MQHIGWTVAGYAEHSFSEELQSEALGTLACHAGGRGFESRRSKWPLSTSVGNPLALLASDCAPQLAIISRELCSNGAVLVDSDVDRRDGLVFHVGLHVCDQVLRAELRRWNRASFAMHP